MATNMKRLYHKKFNKTTDIDCKTILKAKSLCYNSKAILKNRFKTMERIFNGIDNTNKK